jgi:tetratricopeptide (TPR) repeat protein
MSKLITIMIVLFSWISVHTQATNKVTELEKRGRESLANRDFDGAVSAFSEVIDLTSHLPVKQTSLSSNLDAANGDLSDDLLRQQVTVIDPRTAAAYIGRGRALLGKGEIQRAINDLDRAIGIMPGIEDAYYYRAVGLLILGRYDLAVADYSRIIKFDPNHAGGYIGRAAARFEIGEKQEALADLEVALTLASKDLYPLIYYRRGELFRRMGRSNEALEDFEHTIKLNPRFASAYLGRGTVRREKEDLNGALADLSEAITLEDTLAPAYAGRAYVELLQGKESESDADIKKALELEPTLTAEVELNLKKIKGWKK